MLQFILILLLFFSLNGTSYCVNKDGIELVEINEKMGKDDAKEFAPETTIQNSVKLVEKKRDHRIQELGNQINSAPSFKEKADQAQNSKIDEKVKEKQEISQVTIVNENKLVEQIAEKANRMQNTGNSLKEKEVKSEVNQTELAKKLAIKAQEDRLQKFKEAEEKRKERKQKDEEEERAKGPWGKKICFNSRTMDKEMGNNQNGNKHTGLNEEQRKMLGL